MTVRQPKRKSQYGEDAILVRLFREIGVTNRTAVEFGAKDGIYKSNTARLREKGWRTILFDSEPEADIVQRAFITRENVNDVFAAAGVPEVFDLLSIDIDGNDLWVWEAIRAQPRVVVIEYNPYMGSEKSVTVPYDPQRVWDRTDYYGASAQALCRLGRRRGYRLYAYTRSNLIFILSGLIKRRLLPGHVRVPGRWKKRDLLQRPWQEYL